MGEPVNLPEKIGHLCMHWAFFDQKIDRLFEIFLQITPTQVACVVASMDNFRARCETLRRLIVNEPPSEKWADLLSAVLDFSGGVLAPKRNRFVHDVWLATETATMRVDKRAVMKKLGAGQRDQIRFNLHYPTDLGDIHTLTAAIWNMSNVMDWIFDCMSRWRRGQLEEPSLQLIEMCNTYFELLHHQWPKEARYLLPQPRPPKSDSRDGVENSYIVPHYPNG